MPKRIKSISELPDWFDIKKYDFSEESIDDASVWYDLLIKRHSFHVMSDIFFHGSDEQVDFFYPHILKTRENPVAYLTSISETSIFGGGIKNWEEYYPDYLTAIKPFTYRRLYQMENRLNKKTKIKIRRWADFLFGGLWETEPRGSDRILKEAEWARKFIDDPIFSVSSAFLEEDEAFGKNRTLDVVEVNLNIPDAILVEHFKDYLKRARRETQDPLLASKFRTPDFYKLQEYGVLAYIDLQLWAYENNISIPNRVRRVGRHPGWPARTSD